MITLVTGATGLVGNNVVRYLLAKGHPVRVLVRSTSNARALAGLEIEQAQGDVCDADSVTKAMQGCKRVVHAAAHVHIGWTGLETSRKVNVEGTENVARAARAVGAKMVHVSSVDALGFTNLDRPADEDTPPKSSVLCPYVITKREAEQVVQDQIRQGLWATIVNPAFMLGPWDWHPSSGKMLIEISTGRAHAAPCGANSFCDVRDVAAGILSAFERGQVGRRYILGGETLTYGQAWSLFAEVTGVRKPRLKMRRPALFVAGLIGDMITKFTGKEGNVNSAATKISTQSRSFSSRRAVEELGYTPGPIRQAAVDAWQWFKEYGYA
jgi:dihydroflavonol-4-reductase